MEKDKNMQKKDKEAEKQQPAKETPESDADPQKRQFFDETMAALRRAISVDYDSVCGNEAAVERLQIALLTARDRFVLMKYALKKGDPPVTQKVVKKKNSGAANRRSRRTFAIDGFKCGVCNTTNTTQRRRVKDKDGKLIVVCNACGMKAQRTKRQWEKKRKLDAIKDEDEQANDNNNNSKEKLEEGEVNAEASEQASPRRRKRMVRPPRKKKGRKGPLAKPEKPEEEKKGKEREQEKENKKE